jgi:hypothetical protein
MGLTTPAATSASASTSITSIPVSTGGGAPSAATKARFMNDASKKLFSQAVDFPADIEKAFKLWDAVVKGVKVAFDEGLLRGKEEWRVWEEADAWLKGYR